MPDENLSTEGEEMKSGGIRYQVSSEGIILDTKTGLQWYVGPDEDINQYEAEEWIKNLSVAGGDWRFPSTKELREIYEKGEGERNMNSVFKTTGWVIWSEASDSSYAFGFPFCSGCENCFRREFNHYARVFSVRSRK